MADREGERNGKRDAIDRMTRQIRESNPRMTRDEAKTRATEAAIRSDRREDQKR